MTERLVLKSIILNFLDQFIQELKIMIFKRIQLSNKIMKMTMKIKMELKTSVLMKIKIDSMYLSR